MREIEHLQKQWRDGAGLRGLHAQLHLGPDGLLLGAGTVLAKRNGDGTLALEDERLPTLLSVAQCSAIDVSALKHLRHASDCEKAGDALRASMHVALALPVLRDPVDAARRLFAADGLLAAGVAPRDIWTALEFDSAAFDALTKSFNPGEPRNPKGDGDASGEWVNWGGASVLPSDAENRLSTNFLAQAGESDEAEATREAATRRVTAEQLRAIMPGARQSDIDRMIDPLNDAMAAHGISAPAQMAAFLAQGAVESQNLHSFAESTYYRTTAGVRSTFSTFPTDESAAPYVRNPVDLANRAYEGRNGNLPGTDDGYRYRGRGFLQITGRSNYQNFGYEDDPDAVALPDAAAEVSAQWWERNRMNAATAQPLDQQQFFRHVTSPVTGARSDQDAAVKPRERWEAYQRALQALGEP